MHFLLDLVRSHGSLLVLIAAFLENIGLPVPTFAFLILAGCLVAEGAVSLPAALLCAVAGALTANSVWFFFGRWKGSAVLSLFCRLSLNPDACVEGTERQFRARKTITILTARVIPGLNVLVPPLAGVLGMPFYRYTLLNLLGAVLWAGVGLGCGLLFGLEVLLKLESIQNTLAALLFLMITGYVLHRLLYRRHLVRRYSVPRMDPAELHALLFVTEPPVVVDLRNASAFAGSTAKIPGAVRIPPAELELHFPLLPKSKQIIIYCT